MANPQRSQLADAKRLRRFVRFSRRFEDSSIRGYVLDIGPRFFLLALVSDRIWFDGFECFRLEDVSDVKPDPYTSFVEAALKRRGERRPKKPRVSVSSIDEVLSSTGRAFPLVAIHREEIKPDVCHIGRVVGTTPRSVSILEIAPDASWDEEPTSYRLNEITRVNFGGDYEDALALVGQGASR